jgi:NAD(P)-dependent dehydrogenase (short-subunit alcohol dehydrogenase family)
VYSRDDLARLTDRGRVIVVGMALLDGAVAVVTGAGRGLGRSHAVALAAEGAQVVVNDGDGDEAEAVAAEIVALSGFATVDVAKLTSIVDGRALVERAVTRFSRVDVVVNNAGISRRADVLSIDDNLLSEHLDVHVRATIGTTQGAFAAMADGGSIVNTVSGAGLHPQNGGDTAYGAAKAAVYAATKIAALEGASRGIRVNAVSPLARTRMSERYLADREGDFDPAQVSAVVVYLASGLSADLTGCVIRCGGGELALVDVVREGVLAPSGWTPDAVAAVLRRPSTSTLQ